MLQLTLGWAHALAGLALLLLGALVLAAPKRRRGRHGRVGTVYLALLIVTTTSGMVIGWRRPGLSAFEIVTPPTLLIGVAGYVLARWRPRRWLPWHLSLMAGSYIGVVTAFAFQVAPRLFGSGLLVVIACAVLPTLIGNLWISRVQRRWVPRPRRAAASTRAASAAERAHTGPAA